jgi:hypothetical protein
LHLGMVVGLMKINSDYDTQINESIAGMDIGDRKIHHFLNCKDCCMPIMLLAETIQPLFADQEHLANQSHAIAVRCDMCKSVETYILHRQVEGHNPKDRVMATPDDYGVPVHVTTLECVTERCRTLLPLFARWTPSTTEKERIAEISTWRWENLKCPEGHSMPKPDWSFYGVG